MVKQRSGRVNADRSYKGSAPHQKSLLPFLRWILGRHAALGGITEIRAIAEKPSKMIWSGYFDDKHLKQLVDLLLPYENGPRPKLRFGEVPVIGEANFYFTMQAVNPALLARSAYEFGRCPATSDKDIIAYTLFAVDIDYSARPSGVSATKEEKKEARKTVEDVAKWFDEREVPFFSADSGNGYHLLIPTTTYTDVAQASANAHTLLQLLHRQFSSDNVKVDTTIANAGRILKLYGTLAMKGSSIAERPHRFAKVWMDDIPEDIDLFGILGDELEAFRKEAAVAKSAPAADKNAKRTQTTEGSSGTSAPRPRERSGSGWDVETSVKVMTGVLLRAELPYRPKEKDGDHFFEFRDCPHHQDPDGHTHECCVIVRANGSLAAKCQHDAAATWKDHFKPVIGWDKHVGAVMDELGITRKQDTYRATPDGLCRLVFSKDGTSWAPVANFNAQILNDVAQDDGVEVQHTFEIEATLRGRTRRFFLPSQDFITMNWPIEKLGAQAIIRPGDRNKEHARTAIQELSGDVPTQTVYTHLGWRQHGDKPVYLHAGGAIGANGSVEEVRVQLTEPFSRFVLPALGTKAEIARAVRASMRLLKVAPDPITMPLFGAIWRAAIGGTDYSLHLVGPTGVFKSALAALAQQHWGPTLDARNLPANWSSTSNTNEALAFLGKDAILVVDDFSPTGSRYDVDKAHREADRLLRGQGNLAGRGRMRADTTLRPSKPPRGTIVSTGEDIPRGQSLRARMLVIEVPPNAVDVDLLTKRQGDAAEGLYAMALAAFVQWLAGNHRQVNGEFKKVYLPGYRKTAAADDRHKRTPGIVADLYFGLSLFSIFAQEYGVLSHDDDTAFFRRAWEALGIAAAAQVNVQIGSEPVQRFLDLLNAAVATGQAHVANDRGGQPAKSPEAWGWRRENKEWQPNGRRIGWVDDEGLYLEPEAAYLAVQALAQSGGEPLAISSRTLHKRLDERKLLVSTDSRGRLLIRKQLAGNRRSVLHLAIETLVDSTDGP